MRIQCISRLRLTSSLPTTGTLFSAWQETTQAPHANAKQTRFSLGRLLAYARREMLEIRRDPVRLAFALFGTVLLMVIFGYGMTMDVEKIAYAVLDRDDDRPESGWHDG